MRPSLAILSAALILAAATANAGDLNFVNGQTTWRSTQCVKPTPPTSLVKAQPDTGGEEMNTLADEHNAYVDAGQNYMNCIANESDHDQTAVNQSIAASAQAAIADMQNDLNADAVATRDRQRD